MRREETVSRKEYYVVFSVIVLGFLLRIFYIYHYRFDSDEPQHLHIAWAWMNGFLPYRDVFDNHMPLFHFIYAPVLSFFGERADILYFMRLAVLPVFFLGMWCAYVIGNRLFSRRVGIWTTALMSIYPAFFFCSLQFRADVLWMVFWLAGLAVILGRPVTMCRSFFMGFFFGLAMCVSDKTVLLMLSLLLSALILVRPVMVYIKPSIFVLIGFLVMPVITIVFFACHNAFGQFFYCTVSHNILPGLGHWEELWRIGLYLFFLIYLSLKKYRSVLFLTVVIYFLSLFGFWPIVTRQNFLPVYFLIGMLVIDKLLVWLKKKGFSLVKTFILLSLIETAVIFVYAPPWENETKGLIEEIAEVLKLTNKDDWVLDQKGETVYRKRPYYYALESFTRERLSRGILPDNISDELIAKRCYVVTNENLSKFPPDARRFMEENYIPVGYMRAAGKYLEPGRISRFELRVPGVYAIIADDVEMKGILDGVEYTGPCFLDAGTHEFISKNPKAKPILIWSQAVIVD